MQFHHSYKSGTAENVPFHEGLRLLAAARDQVPLYEAGLRASFASLIPGGLTGRPSGIGDYGRRR
jgi:hypothetical protein